jgi:GT2 family glycosyltransferase
VSISVVIVAHRPHRWLRASLGSVLDDADDVVLVDNGSPGAEVSGTGRDLGARVLRVETNLGFTGGANLGMEAANGDVVALLNDDAMADPGWLATAAEVLGDDSVAAVAPKTLFAAPHLEVRFDDEPHWAPGDPRPLGRCLYRVTLEGRDVLPALVGPGIHGRESGRQGDRAATWRWTSGRGPFFVPLHDGDDPSTLVIDGEPAPVTGITTVVNNAGSYLSAEGHGGDYGFGAPDDGVFDEAGDRFAASGVAMAIRRETLLRLGYFAPRFFAYYEDSDWCWRAQLAGMRVRYDPRGVVRHVGGATSGGPRHAHVRFLAARNRLLTLARNAPLRVLGAQLPKALRERQQPSLPRSLAGRLPEVLVQRRRLARQWQRAPADVWREWAGVGETWPPPHR